MQEVVSNTRYIPKPGEGLHFCDQCENTATTSCTDARETESGWTESAERYGCNLHPVQSFIYFKDGRSISAKKYEQGLR